MAACRRSFASFFRSLPAQLLFQHASKNRLLRNTTCAACVVTTILHHFAKHSSRSVSNNSQDLFESYIYFDQKITRLMLLMCTAAPTLLFRSLADALSALFGAGWPVLAALPTCQHAYEQGMPTWCYGRGSSSTEALLTLVRQGVACSRLHNSVSSRFGRPLRWLLHILVSASQSVLCNRCSTPRRKPQSFHRATCHCGEQLIMVALDEQCN